MPTRTNNSVAIVGAAGFVGRVLLRQLQEAGVKATAVVRGAPELAVEGSFHDARSPADLSVGEGFETVINLAYPNSGPPYSYPSQGEAIQRSVVQLVRDGGRVIQVSSLAVFGMALDRHVQRGPVSAVRDHPYVEAKIAAEHGLEREATSRQFGLDIVRLGNVWGPGSGAWGVPIVQRLVTGRPVGLVGESGHSNTTDVANVAAYLRFLLSGSRGGGRDVRYHHLAEFSSVTWSDWIAPVANALGLEPAVAERSVLALPTSARAELASLVATPRTVYRHLAGERVTGSVARSALRLLPPRLFVRAKGVEMVFAETPALDHEEQTFLAIMNCQQEFMSAVDPAWNPAVTRDQAMERFLVWLSRH